MPNLQPYQYSPDIFDLARFDRLGIGWRRSLWHYRRLTRGLVRGTSALYRNLVRLANGGFARRGSRPQSSPRSSSIGRAAPRRQRSCLCRHLSGREGWLEGQSTTEIWIPGVDLLIYGTKRSRPGFPGPHAFTVISDARLAPVSVKEEHIDDSHPRIKQDDSSAQHDSRPFPRKSS